MFRFVVCLCFLSFSTYASKLNTPSVLLNYMYDLPTRYTLFVSGDENSCFQWFSSNPRYIAVTPIFKENCSRSAIISSIGNDTSIKKITVTAEDTDNSELLTCDVYLDVIKDIQLESISNEILMNGSMAIYIRAKNRHGKTFDSINGIQFDWKLDCPSGNDLIKLHPFSDKKYLPPNDDEMEIRGIFASFVLAYGNNTGTCQLTAFSKSYNNRKSAYEILKTQTLKLKVVSNVEVMPSKRMNALQGSIINVGFKPLENYIKVEPTEVTVSISEPGIVELSEDLKTLIAITPGYAELTYTSHNNRFPDTKIAVNVMDIPDSIEIEISEGNFFNLQEMHSYFLRIVLKNNENELIPAENLRVKVKFPSKLFHLNTSTKNGIFYHIHTLAPGSGTITAEYKGYTKKDGSLVKGPLLSTSVKVRVCHKLDLFPPSVFLPSETDELHEVSFRLAGGTGAYSWGVDDPDSATFLHLDDEDKSMARIALRKNFTEFSVYATDENNINFKAYSKVSVKKIESLDVYPTVTEAEVGNTLLLPVAYLGYEEEDGKKILRKFDDCSKIKPKVEIINVNVLRQIEGDLFIPAFGKGCLTLTFKCLWSGHTRINVIFNHTGNTEVLKTTTVLACYKQIVPVYPVRVASTAIGSAIDIAFEGGPRKWVLFPEGFYTNLTSSNPSIADITLIKDPVRYNKDLSVFHVFCKKIGESVLLFSIGNNKSATNPHPATSETSIKLICSVPNSIHLKVHKTSERAKKEEANVVKVPFYGEKKFSLDLWMKDKIGRKLSNITSYNIVFDISDESLVTTELGDVTIYENAVNGYRKVSRTFKEFQMTGKTGDVTITAKVTGYKDSVLSMQDINAEPFEEISSSIDLKLVSLRDLNAGFYENQNEENVCDGDSCKKS